MVSKQPGDDEAAEGNTPTMTTTLTTTAPAAAATFEQAWPLNDFRMTNSCECGYCPTCEMVTTSDTLTCDECDTDLTPVDYCDGYCNEGDADVRDETVNAWLAANDSTNGFVMLGSNMGWRNLDGSRTFSTSTVASDIAAALDLDTEWTQRWTVHPHQGGVFRVVMSHHDSPCGESYTLHPRIGCLTEDDEFSEWDN